MAIVDTSKLGMRERKVVVFKPVTDPNSGLKRQRFITETKLEQSPLLTLAEAQQLAEADWEPSPPGLLCNGAYFCKANERKWFCNENPKPEPKPKKGSDK